MKYVFALIIIVVFNLVAALLASFTGQSNGEMLGALAIGGLAVVAADFYSTKEGR